MRNFDSCNLYGAFADRPSLTRTVIVLLYIRVLIFHVRLLVVRTLAIRTHFPFLSVHSVMTRRALTSFPYK